MTKKRPIKHRKHNKKQRGIFSGVPYLGHFSHIHIRKAWVVLLISPWLIVGVLSGLIIVRSQHDNQSALKLTSAIGITFEVEDLSYDIRGKEPYTAPPGMRFIIAHVEVFNHSSGVFNFAPVVQTVIKADGGKSTYSMAPADVKNPIVAGPIAVGNYIEGDISFLLPSSVDDPLLEFYPGVKDEVQPLKFKLQL